MTSSESFYESLPAFTDIDQVGDSAQYHEVPEDWLLYLSDVRGSTSAILAGRYKEVNTAGVATIIAAHNSCPGLDFPYVFGGDGATIAVPPAYAEPMAQALGFVKLRAAREFGLDLRIASVPVSEIHARGGHLRVAKYAMSPGNTIAMFAGDGIALATAMMKDAEATWGLDGGKDDEGSVEGLECRWNAVPAGRDGMLTLVVRATDDDLAVYREVVRAVHEIVPEPRPVRESNLPITWPPRYLLNEIKLKTPNWLLQRLRYVLLSTRALLLTWLVQKFKDQKGSAAQVYLSELSQNTDFIKLDDHLKMVIDVSHDQRSRIEALLDDWQRAGRIRYGAHFSTHALMTCFIKSKSNHVHFIDGGDGGYTLAAQKLKAQGAA